VATRAERRAALAILRDKYRDEYEEILAHVKRAPLPGQIDIFGEVTSDEATDSVRVR
jgi:hypothetical protein